MHSLSQSRRSRDQAADTAAPHPSADTRQFKGVWIPAGVWFSDQLSINEKVMLIEIDSLQDPRRGCYKSNAGFADFFGLSKSRVSEIIASLKAKGYIQVKQIKKGNQLTERRIFLTAKIEELLNPKRSSSAQHVVADLEPVQPLRNPEAPYSENRKTPSESRMTPSENAALRGNKRGIQSEGLTRTHASPAEAEITKLQNQPVTEGDQSLTALTDDWQPDQSILVPSLQRLSIPAEVCRAMAQDAELIGTFVNYQLAETCEARTQSAWNRKLANWLLRDWQQLDRPQTLEAYQQSRGLVGGVACDTPSAAQPQLPAQPVDCPLEQLHQLWQSILGDTSPAPEINDWINSDAAQDLADRWREGFSTPRLTHPHLMRYVDLESGLAWWQGLFSTIAANRAQGVAMPSDFSSFCSVANFHQVLERIAQAQGSELMSAAESNLSDSMIAGEK